LPVPADAPPGVSRRLPTPMSGANRPKSIVSGPVAPVAPLGAGPAAVEAGARGAAAVVTAAVAAVAAGSTRVGS
jgi:hypothetical protein